MDDERDDQIAPPHTPPKITLTFCWECGAVIPDGTRCICQDEYRPSDILYHLCHPFAWLSARIYGPRSPY